MSVRVAILNRYLFPFVAGFCAAGATAVDSVPLMVALLLAAALFCFASLPVGVRMIKGIAANNELEQALPTPRHARTRSGARR